MINIYKNNKAFTLVELLIVITIIGVLAGITVSIINPQRQQRIAQEAINKQAMLKISEGVQAYYIATNSIDYPDELFKNGNSLPLLQLEEADLPDGMIYKLNNSRDQFCLCLKSLVKENTYLWFNSSTDKLIESTNTCDRTCD